MGHKAKSAAPEAACPPVPASDGDVPPEDEDPSI